MDYNKCNFLVRDIYRRYETFFDKGEELVTCRCSLQNHYQRCAKEDCVLMKILSAVEQKKNVE